MSNTLDYTHHQIDAAANATQAAVKRGDWATATNLWGETEDVVEQESSGCDFYNILTPRTSSTFKKMATNSLSAYLALTNTDDQLNALMNGVIKKKLNTPASVTWGGQSNAVFQALSVDFMQPVISTVDYLLSNNIHTVVYSGNLDLICCTVGTLEWMNKLKWPGMPAWNRSSYTPFFTANGTVGAFTKSNANLDYYLILTAGHMVPSDQPEVALTMVNTLLGSNK